MSHPSDSPDTDTPEIQEIKKALSDVELALDKRLAEQERGRASGMTTVKAARLEREVHHLVKQRTRLTQRLLRLRIELHSPPQSHAPQKPSPRSQRATL